MTKPEIDAYIRDINMRTENMCVDLRHMSIDCILYKRCDGCRKRYFDGLRKELEHGNLDGVALPRERE